MYKYKIYWILSVESFPLFWLQMGKQQSFKSTFTNKRKLGILLLSKFFFVKGKLLMTGVRSWCIRFWPDEMGSNAKKKKSKQSFRPQRGGRWANLESWRCRSPKEKQWRQEKLFKKGEHSPKERQREAVQAENAVKKGGEHPEEFPAAVTSSPEVQAEGTCKPSRMGTSPPEESQLFAHHTCLSVVNR